MALHCLFMHVHVFVVNLMLLLNCAHPHDQVGLQEATAAEGFDPMADVMVQTSLLKLTKALNKKQKCYAGECHAVDDGV